VYEDFNISVVVDIKVRYIVQLEHNIFEISAQDKSFDHVFGGSINASNSPLSHPSVGIAFIQGINNDCRLGVNINKGRNHVAAFFGFRAKLSASLCLYFSKTAFDRLLVL
jgi:hypothetical protein